jgi:hypothetical protein
MNSWTVYRNPIRFSLFRNFRAHSHTIIGSWATPPVEKSRARIIDSGPTTLCPERAILVQEATGPATGCPHHWKPKNPRRPLPDRENPEWPWDPARAIGPGVSAFTAKMHMGRMLQYNPGESPITVPGCTEGKMDKLPMTSLEAYKRNRPYALGFSGSIH